MKKIKFKTDFKIKLSIITLTLIILAGILSYQFNDSNFYIISTIIGVLIMIIMVFSLIGLIRSIKKLRKQEEQSSTPHDETTNTIDELRLATRTERDKRT